MTAWSSFSEIPARCPAQQQVVEDAQEEDREGDKAVGHEEEQRVGQPASVQADGREVVEVLEGQHTKKNFLSTWYSPKRIQQVRPLATRMPRQWNPRWRQPDPNGSQLDQKLLGGTSPRYALDRVPHTPCSAQAEGHEVAAVLEEQHTKKNFHST